MSISSYRKNNSCCFIVTMEANLKDENKTFLLLCNAIGRPHTGCKVRHHTSHHASQPFCINDLSLIFCFPFFIFVVSSRILSLRSLGASERHIRNTFLRGPRISRRTPARPKLTSTFREHESRKPTSQSPAANPGNTTKSLCRSFHFQGHESVYC